MNETGITTAITVICTILGAIVGVAGAINYYKSKVQQDTTCNTRMETKLDYIGKNVDDIKLDFRTQANKINDMDLRLTRVEESTKSAHHRLDEFEK